MQKFVASYEDAEKSAAEAKRHGWTEEDGGMLDYLNGDPPHSRRAFPTKALALSWLVEQIKSNKTLFGCGDIDVLQKVKRRCQYCVCNGWEEVQSFLVDDDGITEEREVSYQCHDDEH